jgi:hypothetical protein
VRPELDADQLRYFADGTDFTFFWHEPERSRDWAAIREDFLADWIRERPGSRPHAWWAYDSPGPRQRVGGVGDMVPAYAIPENMEFGIFPRRSFVTEDHLSAIAPLGSKLVPFDENDPPRFESQAAYLKRHRLLVRGEEVRLTDADFEPEVIS